MTKPRVSIPVPDFYPADVAKFARHAVKLGDAMMGHVDGAIRQRTAGDPAKRNRGHAKREIESAIGHMVSAVISEWHPQRDDEGENDDPGRTRA